MCVIGAGVSGLTAIKALREHGFEVDCYERETTVGGLWNWRHDRSPVYASTHLISSRQGTEYPDFPMPDDWPDYPHHGLVRQYLERYADHFGLRHDIWFGTEVSRVAPTPDGRWDVTTTTGGHDTTSRVSRYAAVVVANGHHWHPKRPEWPGLAEFPGRVLPAGAYKDPSVFRGRRVLVVGAGNTAADLAVEAGEHSARCWLSVRSGTWIVPKYLGGRPADQSGAALRRLPVPDWLRQRMTAVLLRVLQGDLRRFGLPRPEGFPLQQHPTLNSTLLYGIGHGGVLPVPEVVAVDGASVRLADGAQIEPDVIVLATGYEPRFEFLSGELLDPAAPRLWLNVFAPQYPTLVFVGLTQMAAGAPPVAHWQAVAVARWLRAHRFEPERARMIWQRLGVLGSRSYRPRGMPDRERYLLEVDAVAYLRAVERALDLIGRSR